RWLCPTRRPAREGRARFRRAMAALAPPAARSRTRRGSSRRGGNRGPDACRAAYAIVRSAAAGPELARALPGPAPARAEAAARLPEAGAGGDLFRRERGIAEEAQGPGGARVVDDREVRRALARELALQRARRDVKTPRGRADARVARLERRVDRRAHA